MKKAKIYAAVSIISVFLFSPVAYILAFTDPVVCAPGYVQGNVPTTQVPDYRYTDDGFLEFHFRLTTTRWKYNYIHVLDYDKDCHLLIDGYVIWTDKQKVAWPGVNHLVLRYGEYEPSLPGLYAAKAFDGDTGAFIPIDIDTPLGTVTNTYTSPNYRPVHRLIVGHRDAADLDWNAETGDLISTPALPMKITPRKTPVLIVPGVLGTDVFKDSEKLWLDLGRNFTDIGDEFMDPLQFQSDLMPFDASLSVGEVVKKETVNIGVGKITIFDYTFGLIQEFQNQDYIEGTDLFTFPYDWRYGASGVFENGETNEDLLQQKIQDILIQTGSSKVDVVAHSTGGLLVKKYVADHPSDHHIGKAVFVGVPNTGAPKAVKVLLVGDGFGIPWLADGEMQKISENMPVVYDLSPSQQYVDTKGSFVKIIDQNLFSSVSRDLNFSQTDDFLISDHNLNSQALTDSHGLHTFEFDNFDLRSAGIDLYSINGCKTGTLGKIIERRSQSLLGDTSVTYDQPQETPGDGTVPLESATNLPIDANHKYYALKADHGKMLSQDGIRQEIVNLISGSQLATSTTLITQEESKCKLNGKTVSVYSPVDIVVSNAFGNTAGVSEDGVSIYNDIPNADFEIFGDHKFVYLPDDDGQTYSISLTGSDDGTFTLQSQDIDDNQVMQTEIFSDVPVNQSLVGQVNLGSVGTTLSLDTDGDAIFDQVLEPTTVMYPDTTPPEANIQFDPITKDLQFSGTDDVSLPESIDVSDTSNQVTLTDEAGNALDIGFSQTDRRAALKADIKSLTYNGQPTDVNSNLLSFSWKLDSQGVLKSLVQQVKNKGNFSIKAVYDGTTTVLTGTDQTGKISETLSGLVLLKVSTYQGDLRWVY